MSWLIHWRLKQTAIALNPKTKLLNQIFCLIHKPPIRTLWLGWPVTTHFSQTSPIMAITIYWPDWPFSELIVVHYMLFLIINFIFVVAVSHICVCQMFQYSYYLLTYTYMYLISFIKFLQVLQVLPMFRSPISPWILHSFTLNPCILYTNTVCYFQLCCTTMYCI